LDVFLPKFQRYALSMPSGSLGACEPLALPYPSSKDEAVISEDEASLPWATGRTWKLYAAVEYKLA